MPTLAVFQLYRGVNKFYMLDTDKTLRKKDICLKKTNRVICTNKRNIIDRLVLHANCSNMSAKKE